MLCYVTAFLDIGRGGWASFSRSTETYFKQFQPHLDMMRKIDQTPSLKGKYEMIVFLDDRYSIEEVPGVRVIRINEEYLSQNSHIWRTLPRETEIMQSERYRTIFAHRLHFPENSNPKYTLINHAKIDFVNLAMKMSISDTFCWVDFGYFGTPDKIPSLPLDESLFDREKIHYTLINHIEENDRDSYYTIYNAPERLGGFFFLGGRKVLEEYQKLYYKVLGWFQGNCLADDDQHLALQCSFWEPEMFCLHYLGGWHLALLHFQKKSIDV